jgi:Transmembrane secretion effector/Cyclic nucleotide-binding domain
VSILRAYRRLLGNGPLVRLLGGEFVSSIGDWLYLVALLVVVYRVSSDPVLLGVVGAARVLPYVLLSIPAGMAADRFDRRRILLATDLARGAIMLVLAWLVGTGGPLPVIVALAILATCFSTFFGPTIGAYLPSLVRDETELGPANSAWSSLDNLAFIVGPAIGGLLIAASSLEFAFVLNAVSFIVVAAVLWRLPSPVRAVPAVTEGVPAVATTVPGAETSAAAGTGLALRPLAGLAVVDIVVGFVFGGLSVLTVVLAVDHLHAGEEGTGYLNAAIGIGGLVGAILAGILVVRPRLGIPLIGGSIGLGVGLVVLGATEALLPALVAMAVASVGSLVVEVTSTTIFQRIVPDRIRGRALGAIATVSTLAYAAGSFLLPVLADPGHLGAAPVLAGSGALVVLAGIVGVALVGTAGIAGPTAELAAAAAHVADLPLFAGVPSGRVGAAFAHAEELAVAAATVVVREGDPADRFYVILDGTFAVTQRQSRDPGTDAGPGSPAEPSKRLRTMGRDEVFGELGLLNGAPRSATVTAETDGRLLALDAADFLELVTAGADLGPRLLALHRGSS